MGAVYKARHKIMNRIVAIKVMNHQLVGNDQAIHRFHREVEAAARLHHPNIVTAFDADQAGATHFLVMEFVEGTDLTKYVQNKGPLPVALACHFIRQAALGLQHAHECGTVHRDIKPHNLMLTSGGIVKVSDFGLAKLAQERDGDAGLTTENVLMGSIDYMAPEQADDAHAADIRADIYSLGCTFFHLLTGRPPFGDGSAIQKIAAHLMTTVPINNLPAETPNALRAVLIKMLEKNPAQRFQTPAEVAKELVPFIRKSGSAAADSPSSVTFNVVAAATTEGIAESADNPWTTVASLDKVTRKHRSNSPSSSRRFLLVLAAAVACVAGIVLWTSRRSHETGASAIAKNSKPSEADAIKLSKDRMASGVKDKVAEQKWISLSEAGLAEWRQDGADWRSVGDVHLDPQNDTRFVVDAGTGVLFCDANSQGAKNLYSRREFRDIEFQADFVVPRRGNSGIFFLNHYELQVWDSWGHNPPAIVDCGGLFPCRINGDAIRGYGSPPRQNASREIGYWQQFEAVFRAPRFDPAGQLVSPARFVRVVHNGQLIHADVDVTSPEPQKSPGALFLQGGFGAIAYRNIRVRPFVEKSEN